MTINIDAPCATLKKPFGKKDKSMLKKIFACLIMIASVNAMAVVCTPNKKISITSGGVFAMEVHDDKLYLGMFGYDTLPSQPSWVAMVYRYNDDNSLTASDLTKARLVSSESVCALKSWNGYLYAGTERFGKLFRSADGISWEDLNEKGTRDICDFEIGYDQNGNEVLFAINTHYGEYIYTQNGVNWIMGTIPTGTVDPYFRESIYYNGEFYVYGILRTDNRRVAYKSSDLVSWVPVPVPGRVFRASEIRGDLWLSISSVPPYLNQTNIALLKILSSGSYQGYLSPHNTFSHVNTAYLVEINGEEKIVATLSTGFKPLDNSGLYAQGESSILAQFSIDGEYEKELCKFSGQEYSEATKWYKGNLYVGTMHGGYENENSGNDHGWVYKVTGMTQVIANPSIIPIINLLLLDD